MMRLNRRDFILMHAASLGVLPTMLQASQDTAESMPQSDPSLVDVDLKALVARSDLHYLSPVANSLEGQPIGNGRMGTMVWTSPSSVHLQINRVDIFAVNRNHGGAFWGPCDFGGACAAVTVDVGGTPFVNSEQFHQRLSLYEAESHIQGEGVHVRCFVSAHSDVLVLEIDDRRPQPLPVRVTLPILAKPVVQTGEHVARFEIVKFHDMPCIRRTFTEGNYHCRSAVTVHAVNGHLRPESLSDAEKTFLIEGTRPGKTVIHVASAGSMNPKTDVAARTVQLLGKASRMSADAFRDEHRAWWSSFWSRSFIALSSPDGIAEFMQQVRNIHLYLMASTSRGALAPKFNGMLFITTGDDRAFGTQYWGWTMEPLYAPLFAAGVSDLADPYFNMYVAQLPQCRIAAKQRWEAKGAFFPETSPFDGPPTLPDDVAREYRNILLDRPDQAPLSARALELGHFDGSLAGGLNVGTNYTQVSHTMTTGSRIAQHGWWRYRHTGDLQWLRTHGYPLLKETSEFYRSMVKREADGLYHLERSGNYDGWINLKDGIVDLAAIRAVVPLAIRAATILKVDANLRARWQDFLDHLAPFAMGRDPESKALANGVLADDVWAVGHIGDVPTGGGNEDAWVSPVFPFENYTLETPDKEMARIAAKVVAIAPPGPLLLDGYGELGTMARTPIAMARVGNGKDLPHFLCSYYYSFANVFVNGLTPLDGISAEALGVIGMTLQEALMQSVSPWPGEPEVIRVFPAWPETWDATFSLEARGGFTVTSSIKNGVIAFVEIESQRGEPCQIRNPWKAPCFLEEVGKTKRPQSDDLIRFTTRAGAKYRLFLHDAPATIHIAPQPKTTPTSYALTLRTGFQTHGTIGRNR